MEPEIPQNTGSIGRLCLATQSTLHLIHPLGFEISDAKLKRAGLDYWQYLKIVHHSSLHTFLNTLTPETPKVFFSTKANSIYYHYRFLPGSYLIFGKETQGLPAWLIASYPNETLKIPIFDNRVRSLNLAQAVGITVYEAIRQISTGEF